MYLLFDETELTTIEVADRAEAVRMVRTGDATPVPRDGVDGTPAALYRDAAIEHFNDYADLDDPDRNAEELFPEHLYEAVPEVCDELWNNHLSNCWSHGQRRTEVERVW